tara:strand:+ start:455 stop:751 length:297 start_codon:yes stop_codon:yes gene_type:complete
MKNKTQTELNKMTKKNLLLHIENMQLMIENDHLETQRENKEMQDVLARYKEGTPANQLDKVCRSVGKLRYDLFHAEFTSERDKQKVIKMVDNLINTMV